MVADHDTGTVVWIGEGRSQAVLNEFFDLLGEARCAQVEAVSMDMTRIYREATRTALPRAQICFDPFHVIKWAGDTLEQTYGAAPRTPMLQVDGLPPAKTWQKVRTTLRAGAENLDDTGRAVIDQLRIKHRRLHRAWQLKENLRDLYRSTEPEQAAAYLKRWCTSALRSRIPGFITLAKRIRRNFDGITNAVRIGLSNSLVEGVNAGIRLIQRRAHGHANLNSLITTIYLCHGGIPIKLPR